MKLYFVALVPQKKLKQELQSLKEEFAEKYNARHALKLPPHITVLPPFKIPEEKEPYVRSQLESLSSKERPFTLILNGYGSFPPRVIFLKIVNKEPVTALFKRVKNELKDLGDEISEKGDDIHPHITVATRDLSRKAFKKAWPVYKDKEFHADLEINYLVLFRHNGRHWERVQGEFEFSGEGNNTE